MRILVAGGVVAGFFVDFGFLGFGDLVILGFWLT